MAEPRQQAWAMTQIRSVRPPGFLIPSDFLIPRDIKNHTSASQPGGRALSHSLLPPPLAMMQKCRCRCSAGEARVHELFFGNTFFKSEMWKRLVDFISDEGEEVRSTAIFPEATRLFSDLVLYATSRGDKACDKPTKVLLWHAVDKVFTSFAKAALL